MSLKCTGGFPGILLHNRFLRQHRFEFQQSDQVLQRIVCKGIKAFTGLFYVGESCVSNRAPLWLIKTLTRPQRTAHESDPILS